MTVKKYVVLIHESDDGTTFKIKTSGTNKKQVTNSICNFFGCPRSSVYVREVK